MGNIVRKKVPANLQVREIALLVLKTKLSDRRIERQGYGSRNKIARIRQQVCKLDLSIDKIENMELKDLWTLIYPRKKERYRRRMPDWQVIYGLMQKRYQTLQMLWEAYRAEEPLSAYSYTQFTNLYRKFLEKVDITMRQQHRAGECVFVDFAGKPIYFEENGKYVKAQLFVAVAGASNYTFVMAVRDQSIASWIAVHIAMFEFFGGVFEVIVPDNLKSAVIKAGDFPEINRSYLEMANHYGCIIEPTRVRAPQDKGKVEVGVLFVTRWITLPLSQREFSSLDEINQAISELLPHLNNRPFNRLPGCRESRFAEIDKPVLKPLPKYPFVYMTWAGSQKVPKDYHVYVNDHAYSVPYKLVGEKVEVRFNDTSVEIFSGIKKIATHKRNFEKGGTTTDTTHMPEEHQKYALQTREDFLNWALPLGQHILQVIQKQFEGKQEKSYEAARACFRIQKLNRLYGKDRLESACRRAVELNSMTYRTVESLLRRNIENMVSPEPVPQRLMFSHTNIRGAGYYSKHEGVSP